MATPTTKLVHPLPDFGTDEARPNPAILCAAVALRGRENAPGYGDLLTLSGCALRTLWPHLPGRWNRYAPIMEEAQWSCLSSALGITIAAPAGQGGITGANDTSLPVVRERVMASIDRNLPVIGHTQTGCTYTLCVGYVTGGAEVLFLWKAIFHRTGSTLRPDSLFAENAPVCAIFGSEPPASRPAEDTLLEVLRCHVSANGPQRLAAYSIFSGSGALERAALDAAEFSSPHPELTEQFATVCLTLLHQMHDSRTCAAEYLDRKRGEFSLPHAVLFAQLRDAYRRQSEAIQSMVGEYLNFTTQYGLYRAFERYAQSWTSARQQAVRNCFAQLAQEEQTAEGIIAGLLG